MRVHVVANPAAGRGRVPPLLAALEDALARRGARVSGHRTSGPGDARAHVASLATDACDRLVVVGGDGTLHEVVASRPGPLPWPVALVPVGTANLVGRDCGVPLRGAIERRADAVMSAHERVVDLLDTDRGSALAVVGVGIDADVVEAVSRARGLATGGYARWVMPIARTIAAYRAPRLRVSVDDGPDHEAGAVVVQNTFCYGGLFSLSPDARMDDGTLDVVLLRRAARRDYLRTLVRAWTGSLPADRGVEILRGRSVTVRSLGDEVRVQADGDPAGTTPVRVHVVPRALRLITPTR
jgi:YegS/Rv2252/BmrU family lipid kinase